MNPSHKLLFIIFAFTTLLGCSHKEQLKTKYEIEFQNPILHIDYSDPDVIQVGSKYYMTASSFNCIPGLPLLESTNLIDWTLVGHAIDKLNPESTFSKPQHGNGVWAPSIRYHNNQFYIYYGDPDFGIYMLSAKDFAGPWSKPYLIKGGKGWIDPCPFWDDNGEAWLVHAWAGSRAGIKSTLTLHKMSVDGKNLLDNGVIIFDGHEGNRTVEGPKMYKRNGFYYVFAPAGGVSEGWQLVLKSNKATGPYEARKIMHQGSTNINGPHQGAWVDSYDGSSWFFHFQDKGAYGRIVHLQPMAWINYWPVIGDDQDEDGCGEPVAKSIIKSNAPRSEVNVNQFSDEFNIPQLNKHWQWHANPTPKWGAPSGHLGYFRLNAAPFPGIKSLWDAPNLLLQKFPSDEFTSTCKLDIHLHEENDRTGMLIMGYDYAWLGIERKNGSNYLVYKHCIQADKGGTEKNLFSIPWENKIVYIKTMVKKEASCTFSFSANDKDYTDLDELFTALPGKWIGAKVGLFCISDSTTNDAGYVNADWFRIVINK